MNTFEMKTAIHFGNNALDRLKEIPYKRVLVITDPFVVQSSMIDLITAPLNSAGIEYDIFHDVVPDAPIDKIAEGVKKFLQYQPDAVIAVGGGSAIDSSKAIREFALKINNYGKSRSDRNSNYKWNRIRSHFFCSSKRYNCTYKISADFRQPDSR